MIPSEYLAVYLGANAVALGILALAFWKPRWTRWLMAALFFWAAWVNARTAIETPYVYLAYAWLTPSEWYRSFIQGWFSGHIRLTVLSIAAGQLLLAVLFLGPPSARKLGGCGAAVFLLAIAPLGVGSGFPFSLIAIASLLVMEWRWPKAVAAATRPAAAFVPDPDVRELHTIVVRAPASLVFETATRADPQSVALVRAIFRVRSALLRDARVPRKAKGLVAETLALGWGVLAYVHGRTLVMGASARPWARNVTFDPIPPERFRTFDDPGLVKIVWTLEVEPLGPALTRFVTETRVEATDEGARRRFRWYWRAFGAGIVLIRVLMVRQVRREAERRFRRAEPLLARAA